MARSTSDLDGWKVITTDEAGNILDENRKRSRRRGGLENVSLVKELGDGKELRFGCGSSIIVQNETEENDGDGDSYSIHMVHEIRLHTMNNLLELWTYKYLRSTDIIADLYYKQFNPDILKLNETPTFYAELLDKELDKNEIYLTLYKNEVSLKNVKGVANIVKKSEWTEEKTPNQDFIVNYICMDKGEDFIPIDLNQEARNIKNMNPKDVDKYMKCILYPLSDAEKENDLKEKISRRGIIKRKKYTERPIIDDSDTSDDSISDSGDEYIRAGELASNEGSVVESSGDEEEQDEGSAESDENENYTETEKTNIPRKRGRRRKSESAEHTLQNKKLKIKNQSVRRFTKRNVVRAKKKYTPFSKKYKSINDIPDLTNFGDFNAKSANKYLNELEDKLNTKSKHKIVETIFSKVKKQLYSSHGKEEIVKAKNFEDYLPARENEFASIYLSVYSAIESSSATTVYIAGTPGVGKTLTVREVMKELHNSVSQEELPPFQYVEINGLKMVKPTDSYEVLWHKISGELLTWGAAMESLEFYFSKVPKEKKRPIVVLLDELDALITKQEDIMYNFFNWTSYENAKFVVVAVANTMDLPERQLGNKVSSRIGFTRIMFTGYTHEELKTIIDLRLQGLNNSFFYVDTKTGNAYLTDDYVSENTDDKIPENLKKVRLRMSSDAIEIASRKIASVSGDARRALKACKRAAEIAEQHYMAKHGYNYDGHVIIESKGVMNTDFAEEIGEDDSHIDDPEKGIDEQGNEYEVQVVRINHIMKALNETTSTNVINFVSRSSFTTKLFLFAFMNLIKKSGYEEQTLGDVVDEVSLLINVNGNNKFIMSITETLFPKNIENDPEQLRMISWDFVIGKLVEAGIIVKQIMKNERVSSIKFNVSIGEIKKAIEQDNHLKDL